MKTMNFTKLIAGSIILAAVTAGINTANAQERRNSEKYNREYNRNDQRKEYRPSSHKDKSCAWDNHHSYQHNDYHKTYHVNKYYYEHPKYGRVYHKFDRTPVVFHYSQGNYYYYDNRFYRYYDGIGYCIVDAPRNVVFHDLPVACNRVVVNGHVYWRNGDLYFATNPGGFVLVPSPVQISISARF